MFCAKDVMTTDLITIREDATIKDVIRVLVRNRISGIPVVSDDMDTVPRLYPVVRPEADYRRSLECLGWAKQYAPAIPTKSGLMLGLGELPEEVNKTLRELLEVGCSMLTLGQYLQPTREHLPVDRFIHPKEFDNWKETALGMGFSQVASGPFVRSSYHAKELYHASEI